MQLTNNSWYVRWFFWSLGIWGEFRDLPSTYDAWNIKEKGTNLCFFIRTMFVSAPLAILLNIITYVVAIASITYFPIKLLGGWGYLYEILIIAFVGGVVFLARYIKRVRMYKKYANESDDES